MSHTLQLCQTFSGMCCRKGILMMERRKKSRYKLREISHLVGRMPTATCVMCIRHYCAAGACGIYYFNRIIFEIFIRIRLRLTGGRILCVCVCSAPESEALTHERMACAIVIGFGSHAHSAFSTHTHYAMMKITIYCH